MKHTTHITIEHIVVASSQPYEKVVNALEEQLGPIQNWGEILLPLFANRASWEQIKQAIEGYIKAPGLTIFNKVEHTSLLSLVRKTSRASQYTIGNPLFAIQMTRYTPEVALYVPLKLVVYEDEEGKTFVAYDSIVSLLAQYQHKEIKQVAQIVEQKLEALVADVTGN
jgi:uncharacterized protein (DUF302 family)